MQTDTMNLRERAIYWTKQAGILPAIKIKQNDDLLPYVRAMHAGGARIIEITMTTPGVLEQVHRIASEFGGEILTTTGTTLDAATAREAILAGASAIVTPAVKPEVIATARRYGVACYCGAFTATECLAAMEAGADMVKIFPASLGGPKYMTNLKMVFPEIDLIPSGGISLETAADFIRCGACAVSGARNFFDYEKVQQFGLEWITHQIEKYISLVAEAKASAPPLP
jgi:2-dehydro-3-deoxyphosphogluconate aldolase/(4S)-4-hydroxy-2-oxoglutarate aldolase